MIPIPAQGKGGKTSNVHPYPHKPAPPAGDKTMSILAILERRYGTQQQDSKTSTYIKPEAAGNHGWTGRDLPTTPKSLRPSLVAPVLVSPAVSDISQDSSEDEDSFWDTPLGDGGDRSGMANIDTLTPLTPPSSSKRVRSETFEDAQSPLLRKMRRQTQAISDTVPKPELDDTTVNRDAGAADGDYFSFPRRQIFRVPTLLETIKKSQPQERFPNKPDTNFSQPRKLISEEATPKSAILEKNGRSSTTFQAIVKSEQSPKINTKKALSTDESVRRSTISATVVTKSAVSGKICLCPHIVPFDVLGRLKNSASLCVAFTNGGERCGRQAQDSGLVQSSLNILATHYGHQDYDAFLAELKTFIHQALCGRSHRKPAIHRIETSGSTIRSDSAKERCKEILVALFGAEDAAAFCLWAEAISDLPNPQTLQVLAGDHKISVETASTSKAVTTKVESQVALSTDLGSMSVLSTTKISVATTPWLSGFHLYQSKKNKSLQTNVALRQAVEANLTETDLKLGSIYIFWLKGMSFGHLKIGRSNDPYRRIQEWNKQCKVDHVLVEDMIKIPHVSRIEKLIHLELKDLRKSMKCAGCGRNHCEWFEISESNARRVLKKWQDWIKQHPYEKDHTGNWTLKPSSGTTVADICQPLLLDAKPLMPLGPKKPRSPPVKPTRSKKYKPAGRDVSEASSLENSNLENSIIMGGRVTEKDNMLPKVELPGDALKSESKLYHSECATIRNPSRLPKSEVSEFTLAQGIDSLPPKGGNSDNHGSLSATICKGLSSKRTDNHTTQNQAHVNTAMATAETEYIEEAKASASIQMSIVATSRKLWYQRLSEMKICISQGKGKCIATTKKNKRCSCKSPGSQHEIVDLLNAWSKCLDEEDYTAIPAIVRKFFESAVCGNQRFATMSLIERIESLNKLATGSDYDVSAYAFAAIDFLNTKSVLWHMPVSDHHGTLDASRPQPKGQKPKD